MNAQAENRLALLLGVRMAELDALCTAALTASTATEEKTRLAELATAAARLSASAASAARGRRTLSARPPVRRRTRLERRVNGARRTADRIIARSAGG
ncbi:hypothetical protein [Actinomadura rayongensis]|uniref:Uncharacterized protein n=1 Tax=Actinomadura rayongensis TaxID=1429076 RepID=A0A6I4W6P8_9ACTN|nr:hypothetical protein [Actinomadura rayongensis]MXQ64963.1 hypothetical protein [Actinomadura rayongensis]